MERMPEQYIRNSQLLEFTEANIPHTSGYIRVIAGPASSFKTVTD